MDRGRRPREAGRRHLTQGDLAPGCAHQVVLHVVRGVALLFGQAHVDSRILAPPLHPECFGPEEGRPDLRREVADSQIQCTGCRLQLQLQFPESLIQVASNVEDTRDTRQLGDEFVLDLGQPCGVRMREFEVNRESERDQVRGDRDGPDIRKGRDLLPPEPLEGGCGDAVALPVDELELDGSEVAAGRLDGVAPQGVEECRRLSYRYGDTDLQRVSIRVALTRDPLERAMPGSLQLRRDRRCSFSRRADRQFQTRRNDFTRDGSEELIGDHARTDNAHRQHEQAGSGREHDGGLVDRQAQPPVERAGHDPLQEAVHTSPDAVEPPGQPAFPRGTRRGQVGQVVREYEERLDQ